MQELDFDLLVVGDETEGCLAAVAGARAGARVGLLARPGRLLGGLLTEDGLAFVDRDSRHLIRPDASSHDGIFGEFLARAGVALVALPAGVGARTLRTMLDEAGVTCVTAAWTGLARETDRLWGVRLASGELLLASHFIDATPDGDLAEAAGVRFSNGFSEYGIPRYLGVSPLPVLHGVAPAEILETSRRLQADPGLEALRQRVFGERAFLDLDAGADYLLLGPPHLGLAYQRWREAQGLQGPFPFEADGFNVAIVGPRSTSWNGLIYFCEDPETLLALSRGGADDFFRAEAAHFERFLRSELGWHHAEVALPQGVYVRQTRHALDVRHRLTLDEIGAGYDHTSVGTFCYYPDFRGFRSVRVPGPLTAHVILEAGLAAGLSNLAIAGRAAGYTPFAHSLCRLVQYNVTLGAALGVAAALGGWNAVPTAELRAALAEHHLLADDPAGIERNAGIRRALSQDPLLLREHVG
ncbi:MAG TPA: FAD-dependent oxidoreductase [Oscillatoriaceae cyanobacterium]